MFEKTENKLNRAHFLKNNLPYIGKECLSIATAISTGTIPCEPIPACFPILASSLAAQEGLVRARNSCTFFVEKRPTLVEFKIIGALKSNLKAVLFYFVLFGLKVAF